MQKLTFDNKKYYADNHVYYNLAEILDDIKSKIIWLESHNKNYTKEQYYKICDLYDFIRCLEIENHE